MKLRQMISMVFLLLGFLFSSIIRIRFNLSGGFEFHSLWITWIPSIFDFAFMSSTEKALNTTFLGYAFYVTAGILMLNDQKTIGNKNNRLIVFMGISVLALVFEVISLIQDLFTSYYGQHLRIGLLLFLFGLLVFMNSYRKTRKQFKMPFNQTIKG